MAETIGSQSLERIAARWQVDEDRIVWTDQGFDWWPGRYRVSVKALAGAPDADGERWRLAVRTDVLKDVPLTDEKLRSVIAEMAAFAPTYAWVFAPPDLDAVFVKNGQPVDRRIWFQSSVYVDESSLDWAPDFLARMTLMHPTDAERMGDHLAETLRGSPDTGAPNGQPVADHLDEMLNVPQLLYAPAGQEPSRWCGSGEFEEFAERFAMQDSCFGFGDPNGLTVETPIGSDSALVRLHTDLPHPALGHGLLATAQLPAVQDRPSIVAQCQFLNYLEAVSWTDVPQLGSWHPKERGKGCHISAHGFFIPNALFVRGMASNAAFWQLGRARFAKQLLWRDVEDLTMAQIITARFGESVGS